MKKMMYLHGFASSGASGTVELLRREFWEKAAESCRAVVVAPAVRKEIEGKQNVE